MTKNRFSRVTYSFRSTICQTTEVDVQLCKMKMFYTRTKYMNLEPGLNSEPGLMVYTAIHRLMYCALHLYHCTYVSRNTPLWKFQGGGRRRSSKDNIFKGQYEPKLKFHNDPERFELSQPGKTVDRGYRVYRVSLLV